MRPPGRPTAETGGTAEKLLRAAERLFAERGFAGTPVRGLAADAGANASLVGYHFGSKAALFDLIERDAPTHERARLRAFLAASVGAPEPRAAPSAPKEEAGAGCPSAVASPGPDRTAVERCR